MSDRREDPPAAIAGPADARAVSILIVAWDLQSYGGLETRLVALLHAAAARRWKVTLLTARPLPDGPLMQATNETGTGTADLQTRWRRSARGRFAIAVGALRAAVERRSLAPLRDRTRYGHRSFTRYVADYWSSGGSEVLAGATVVHLVGAPKQFLVQTLRAASGQGVPVAYQAVHEVTAEYVQRRHFADFVGTCNLCSLIFTSHPRQSDAFREHFRYEGRILEIPQWCYEDEPALLSIDRVRSAARPPRIGSLSRLDEVKGLDTLVEAAARAAGRGVDFELVIGGSGPTEAQLRSRADALGIGDRVRFVGHVADREHFYRSIDVFVLASTSEGGPITGVEAMAAGLPILTTPVGAMPERVQDGRSAIVFPAGDAPALSALIEQVAKDPGLRERLGAAARSEYVARFRATLHESTMIEALGSLSQSSELRS